jgi:hypothetical protein
LFLSTFNSKQRRAELQNCFEQSYEKDRLALEDGAELAATMMKMDTGMGENVQKIEWLAD